MNVTNREKFWEPGWKGPNTAKQIRQRVEAGKKGGAAKFEKYGAEVYAAMDKVGGKWNFFDMVAKANAEAEEARRRPRGRAPRGQG